MPDQKQTVIDPWDLLQRLADALAYSASTGSCSVADVELADEARCAVANRPVPSGADALRQALKAARGYVEDQVVNPDGNAGMLLAEIDAALAAPAVASSGAEGGEREECDSCEGAPGRAVGDPEAPEFICDDCLIDMGLAEYHRARNAEHAPPPAPAEGLREAVARGVNVADNAMAHATNAGNKTLAESYRRERDSMRAALAAAPAPAVTDPEGDEPDAYSVCLSELRERWTGEASAEDVVRWMFCALDEAGDRRVPRDENARVRAVAMANMVFADLEHEGVDRGAVVSNVLRACERRATPAPSKETSTDA